MNLSKSEIYLIVRDIVAQELDLILPEDSTEISFQDIVDEWVIDMPCIITECEHEFGIAITDDEMNNLEIMEDLANLIYDKINN